MHMNIVIDKIGTFLNAVKKNKKLLLMLIITILVLLSLILNIAFSFLLHKTEKPSTNITVGDLKYSMVINNVNLNSSVGTKLPTNTIIGDRIIVLKSKKTEQFNIVLTSNNDKSTYYEIIYHVCSDENCTSFIDTPETIQIAYHVDSLSPITDLIASNESRTITIVTDNQSTQDYYVEVDLNVGYKHNKLVLQKQISNKFTPPYLSGNLDIIATVNGEEIDGFPTEPDYETNFVCKENDGTISKAKGIFRYTAANGWEFDVYGLTRNHTTCYISFTSTEYVVTYELLSTRLDCANITAKPDEPIITYTGNCDITSETEKTDGSHRWKLKFTTSGTLSIRGQMFVDAFLVGGGQGGAKKGVGGAGGKTIVYNTVRLANDDTYTVTIGAGGTGGVEGSTNGKLGSPSTLISNTSAENFSLTSANGYDTNAGGAGGSDDDASNNLPGQCRTDKYSAEFHDPTSGIYYAGGGGGSGGQKSWYSSGQYWYRDIAGGSSCGDGASAGSSDGSNPADPAEDNTGAGGGGGRFAGGTGGSGIIIIRDTRA